MTKKKVSGQTIAIVILGILLLISIGFGAVYAYYSSKTNQISGKIIMANLNIDLRSPNSGTGQSESSQIVLTHSNNIVPNQNLFNTPLIIDNYSLVPVYLMMVYEVDVKDIDGNPLYYKGEVVEDDKVEPFIDIGVSYVNPTIEPAIEYRTADTSWIDYVFSSDASGEQKTYRCLVSPTSFLKLGDAVQEITVIKANTLKLSKKVDSRYQTASITFQFQAFAIGAGSFEFDENVTDDEKCHEIVSAIYESEAYEF